jgi:hypothetical protein
MNSCELADISRPILLPCDNLRTPSAEPHSICAATRTPRPKTVAGFAVQVRAASLAWTAKATVRNSNGHDGDDA